MCGSIAAYKAADLCRRLMDGGAHVSPVMTEGATRFLGTVTLSALASEPVRISLWDEAEPAPHIVLARNADLIVVAPATARVIAAYAAGLSDDLLTATLLATRTSVPVVVCPAMHTEMWEHPATGANVDVLRRRGVHVVEPAVGTLAGGDVGVGRMAEPIDIMAAIAGIVEGLPRPAPSSAGGEGVGRMAEPVDIAGTLPDVARQAPSRPAGGGARVVGAGSGMAGPAAGAARVVGTGSGIAEAAGAAPARAAGGGRAAGTAAVAATGPRTAQDLAGVRVLVTAGGTREPLDAVRFVANRSSGKQGHALAEEAAARGASVTLVTAAPLAVPAGVEAVTVDTAAEMEQEVLPRVGETDVVVMAAAVADFRPKAPQSTKLKKMDGLPDVILEPTADILAAIGRNRRPDQVLVGFAAETCGGTELADRARAKLRDKRVDMIVANDVSAPDTGFGHDTNEVVLVAADGSEQTVALTDKREVAARVLDVVVELLRKRIN